MGILTRGPSRELLRETPLPRFANGALGLVCSSCQAVENQCRALQRWVVGPAESRPSPMSEGAHQLRRDHPEMFSVTPFTMTSGRKTVVDAAIKRKKSQTG